MTVMIRPATVGNAIVELLRQKRSGRAQRLLETLLLVDDGDGVEIGVRELCRLAHCEPRTMRLAIAELREEGLLSVTPPPPSGYEPPAYRLRIATRARHHDHRPE